MATKKTASTTGTRRLNYTYWVTRDSDPFTGALLDHVRVWLARPEREREGLGHHWFVRDKENFYATWKLSECLWHLKTYPDDDRQCLRAEGDRERAPGDGVDRVHS